MRRGLVLTVVAAMLMANVAPAMAQVKPPRIGVGQMARPQVNKPPRIRVPSSAAARQVQQANKGAKLLGIKPSGNGYVATMRQGNRVFRVTVPGN